MGKLYICTVTLAGIDNNGVVAISLRENSGAFNTWFYAPDTSKKEMLAVGLAAMTSGLRVRADLSQITPGSGIDFLAVV